MKIVLIGAGRLATNLGYALMTAGYDIVQVYSRTEKSARAASTVVGGSATTDINAITTAADIYILAVKDSALAELVPVLCKGRESKIFLHTAGSVSINIFKGMALHYGVFYPMQTFSKERRVDFADIPVFYDGNDSLTLEAACHIAEQLSHKVSRLGDEDRKYLHLAAVFANNFVNHCYAISADILKRRGMDFDVMLPLIDETVRKVHDMHPLVAQTGPAIRYDENIIRSQSNLLRANPIIKDIYERMSLSIHQMSRKDHDKL